MAKKKTAAEKQLATANSKIKALGGFSYSDKAGLKSAYDSAYSDYNGWVNNPTAHGFNAYITDVNELYDQVQNYTYDPQKDGLFQMYKNQYQAQGTRAMQNQMGVAAALSGGYNSSVAQTSAQQQYQDIMSGLNDKAAETYQLNRQNLIDRYNTARDMNNAGNDAYWKQVDVRANRMNNAYSAYNDDRTFQYNKYNNDRTYWQTQGQNAQTQINWQKEYDQTNAWNKKNYNLQKKQYKGK